jgi:predicted transcriptional regulator of viral defense system
VVATVFSDRPHRIAYGTALEEHDLVARPSQTICVATTKRMRVKSLSGRPLRTVLEPARAIPVGAVARGGSFVSDIERALLDAAARPELTGGATTLVEATVAAAGRVDPERLTRYARELGWAAALRRIGSIVDALEIHALARKLAPLRPPVAYLDLEPGLRGPPVWRDPRWRVCWQRPREELALATPRAGG